jgi:hypothetical protein
MKLKKIVGIETTTYCNRDCDWCVNSTLYARDMTAGIFDKVLEVLRLFDPCVIAISGCGEPLMDPDIMERIERVSKLGYSPVIYTNGDMLDESVSDSLKHSGLHKLFISRHDGDSYDKINIAREAGLDAELAYSPHEGWRTHNWAGQLDIENTLNNKCSPLEKGWGYINVDGYVCQCCLDYDAKYPLGHVNEGTKLVGVRCTKIPLCVSCTGSP